MTRFSDFRKEVGSTFMLYGSRFHWTKKERKTQNCDDCKGVNTVNQYIIRKFYINIIIGKIFRVKVSSVGTGESYVETHNGH